MDPEGMETSVVTANLVGEENLLQSEVLYGQLWPPFSVWSSGSHGCSAWPLRAGEGHLFIAHKFSLLQGLPAERASALNLVFALLQWKVMARRNGSDWLTKGEMSYTWTGRVWMWVMGHWVTLWEWLMHTQLCGFFGCLLWRVMFCRPCMASWMPTASPQRAHSACPWVVWGSAMVPVQLSPPAALFPSGGCRVCSVAT